jgi:hypothetical protein
MNLAKGKIAIIWNTSFLNIVMIEGEIIKNGR